MSLVSAISPCRSKLISTKGHDVYVYQEKWKCWRRQHSTRREDTLVSLEFSSTGRHFVTKDATGSMAVFSCEHLNKV